jgi:3-isopropylmalate/(R)-2-methylmalate dehydratase small subunit
VVGGRNFGLGSSREHAALVLKRLGVGAVLASSFARIFFRNAVNSGLPVLICDTQNIGNGDELEVDLAGGTVIDLTVGADLQVRPLPRIMLDILSEGGLVPYIKRHRDFVL